MSAVTEAKLAELAANQWGLLTTAQAGAVGVRRSTVLRRAQSGSLDRMRPGVYRLSGAPANRLDEIRAAWVATDARVPAWQRRTDPDVVVGGVAAAWVHQIGDLYPSPYLLYTSERRQTSHDDIRYTTRRLPASDVMIVDGLPVTTRERTIADLLDEADLSVVADAFRDAERADDDLDVQALSRHLEGRAKALGFTTGAELYAELRTRAGVDAERLRDLLTSTDLAARLNAALGAQVLTALDPHRVDGGPDLLEHHVRPPAPITVGVPTASDDGTQQPRVSLPEAALPPMELPPHAQATLRAVLGRALDLPFPTEDDVGLPGTSSGHDGAASSEGAR